MEQAWVVAMEAEAWEAVVWAVEERAEVQTTETDLLVTVVDIKVAVVEEVEANKSSRTLWKESSSSEGWIPPPTRAR